MDYILHILVMASLYVILATSFNLLIGFAGLFALSHAAFYALGAYVTAILTTSLGVPFPIPLIAGVAFVAAVGVLVALPAIRVSGEYLVIISLALQIIVVEVILNWRGLTGGGDGIAGIPNITIFGGRLSSPGTFLPLAIVFAAGCFWIAWRLAHSPFGRALRAMRENASAAQACGKDLVYMKLTVFAFAAGLASIAGGLYAHYFNYVGPDGFTIDETIYILAMVILGGTGNLWGSVVGALVLVGLPEALKFINMPVDIADKARLVIYGALLILILRIRPEGILPEPQSRSVTATATAGGSQGMAQKTLLSAEGSADAQPILEGRGLHKSFGGITAVSGFDIVMRRGQVTGLIGPNGAGKTTAFNLLTGFLKPDRGEIRYKDKSIAGLKPHQIVGAGVARSFQDLRLFTKMTVLENVVVALPRQSGDNVFKAYFAPRQVAREERENAERAMEVLRFVGLEDKADERAENLSYAEEKLLVVARLLATGAEVLLFDEPLSGLDGNALQEIFPVIRRLAEEGKTICIIEHNLDVIKSLCDTVYFLDEGHTMAVGTPNELMNDPELAERYFK
ncbi:branched-chain amino acid ABC transporter ATP-binding protein/permease [Aquibaculum sediminis]|uniref:branched-chain amino acid ABC transporter ATP-binding protein/permease n=1 Tax=Aquibaculum sediminis TaxID=3231907 RepID=UPI003451E19F